MPLTRGTTLNKGQKVHWAYPHTDVAAGEYIVAQDYPPQRGSASLVRVAKEEGGKDYPALPEELTLINPAN